MPEGGCDPVESMHWSRLLAEPVDPWTEEPMLEQVCCRTCDPQVTHTRAVCS